MKLVQPRGARFLISFLLAMVTGQFAGVYIDGQEGNTGKLVIILMTGIIYYIILSRYVRYQKKHAETKIPKD